MEVQRTVIETAPQPQMQQPVLVKTVVKVKKKRSIIGILSSIIGFLLIIIFVGVIIGGAVWLHTYKVFTQEKTVAQIEVSKVYMKDGMPTFKVKYTPYEDISGFWGIFGSSKQSTDKSIETELIGDRLFVEGDFIRWSNFFTFLNFKPVYKINRITAGFKQKENYEKYKVNVVDINGGPDDFAESLQSRSENFNWLAQSIFISAAGVNAQNDTRIYDVKVTEDAIVLENAK